MNILAINTSSSFGEVSVLKNDDIFKVEIASPYSENIMTAIQTVLENASLNFEDIGAVSCVTGPGSFTGIRIGLSVAKGLCFGQYKKMVGVNSFELVSYNIQDSNFVVVIDSGNADMYYAIFKNKSIEEMGFGDEEKILSYASEQNIKVYYSSAEKQKFENTKFNEIVCDKDTLIKISKQKIENDEIVSIQNISPIYIKLSQAEIGLKQKIEAEVVLRNATMGDANALAVIDSQCFDTETEKYSASSFENEFKEPSKSYNVAVLNDLQIGYIGVQTLGDELNLLKIAILPQYQRLGVGEKLLNTTLKYFVDSKFENYFLEVREDNLSAIKFYQKHGFEIVTKREKYYGDKSALVMFYKKQR